MLRTSRRLAGLLLAIAPSLRAQPAPAPPGAPRTVTPSPVPFPVPNARAMRAERAPILDGRDDDAVWRTAPLMQDFVQFDPGEDFAATFRSEARAAFDHRYLYVYVRAYDPHPDSIVTLLSRRDVKTASDQLKIIIDGYLDRRSGVELAVNPAGVKRDYVIYSDNIEDGTWDGVWDVATHIDSLGWAAEFRVPFSQLRFNQSDTLTFGFGIWRDIARRNERDAWPRYRQSQRTLMSQMGTLTGITDIGTPRRLELMPYSVARSVPNAATRPPGNHGELTGGLDLKAGLGANVTIDATVHPDFGQVEADPAVLNLSAFEIRFDERRPFFQEGAGMYRCQGSCEGVFYTRRIGRTPQLRRASSDPLFTDISAAAKLTARFPNGLAFGVVNASTERVVGSDGNTVEPQTNYLVVRGLREFRTGRSQLGFQITDVRRQLDAATDPFLRRSATTALVQGFHRFAQNRWELVSYGALNDVRGSTKAIALTQLNSVHFYQRPDHEERFDSTRTALGGHSASMTLRQIGGRVRYEGYLRYAGAGLEINDLGFVNLVNDMQIKQSVDLRPVRPSRYLRSAFSQVATETHWTTGGLLAAQSFSLHTSGTLHNNWGGALTTSVSDYGGTHCVSCARGGPALRQSAKYTFRVDLSGDPRPSLVPKAAWRFGTSDVGRSWYRGGDAALDARVASRLSGSMGVTWDEVTNDQQWVGNYGQLLSDTTHFTFARLHQHILSITMRANWTATPTLSFQFYGQPFVTTGEYSNWRELASARADGYADRFRPYGSTAPAGFNVKQFNSNAVVRWEYRPASTLFLVWQQGRAGDPTGRNTFVPARDVRDLFGTRPLNTVLLKLSYWLNP